MKRQLLYLLAIAGLFLLIGETVKAQVITEYSPKRFDKGKYILKPKTIQDKRQYEVKQRGDYKTYIPEKRSAVRTRAAGEVSVTCSFEYDKEWFTPNSFMIYNTENDATDYYDYENESITLSVPVGMYDLATEFWRFGEKGDAGGIAILIKEQVVLSKDTTIVFAASDATNHIMVEGYNPDGEMWRLPLWRISDDNMSYEVLDEGNVDEMLISRYFILKGYGAVSTMVGNGGVDEEGSQKRERGWDFFVNDLSDRYLLVQSRVMIKDGVYYVNRFRTEGTESKVLKNDPKDYILYEDTFQSTPLGMDTEGGHIPGFGTIDLFDGVQIGGWDGATNSVILSKDDKVKFYVDAMKEGHLDKDRMDIMVMPQYGDYRRMVIEIQERGDGSIRRDTSYYYSNTIGLPVIMTKNGMEYVNKGHDAYGNYSFQVPEEKGDILEYPGHPAFSYMQPEKTGIYGNSCPINAFMAQNSYDEYVGGKMSGLACCYIGRLGEIRMSDYVPLEMSVKYNGEEICTDYAQLDSLTYTWASEKHPDGEFDLTFVNANVRVDDLPGKNVTRILYDQRKDDWTAPTLQMLHFKNTSGLITDRFETASDGVLEFAGGDFNFHNTDNRFYFDCKEQHAEVFYSSYGNDEWKELPVTEIPELYRMPAFGYFYRGSLESVKGETKSGWYDLKITLTDKAGNQQMQTISPAFKLKDAVGISSIAGEKAEIFISNGYLHVKGIEDASVSLYSVTGTLVGVTADGTPQGVPVSGLPAGIYLVKVVDMDGCSSVFKVNIH